MNQITFVQVSSLMTLLLMVTIMILTHGSAWIFLNEQRVWYLKVRSQNTTTGTRMIGRCTAGGRRLFYSRPYQIHHSRGSMLPLIFIVVALMISYFVVTTDRNEFSTVVNVKVVSSAE